MVRSASYYEGNNKMIKTPFDDLPSSLQNIFTALVKNDTYGLNPSTLYKNTVITAQNSGVSEASKFMEVPTSVVKDALDLN